MHVIVAGDSRAERQVIPEIIKENTSFDAINVAGPAVDLLTTTDIIKKYYANQPAIFVISVSSFQINDGCIHEGYLSKKCFQQLSLKDKVKLFKWDIRPLYKMELTEFFCELGLIENPTQNDVTELGYVGVEETLDTNISTNLSAIPWYKNVKSDGIRWFLFCKAIKTLSQMNSIFIIYQPPVSPFWRKQISGTFIDYAEKTFSQKLGTELRKFKNFTYLDFYTNPLPLLADSLYYNTLHLNRKGSVVFTKYLVEKISEAYSVHPSLFLR